MSALNNSFFETFFETGINSITEETFELVSFQGFDPKIIRKELIKRKWTQKELTLILTFFLVRGTNIGEKVENRSTAEFNNLLATLKNKGLMQRAVDKKDITINRIVASMPEIVAGIIAKHHEKCRILCSDVSDNIPIYLKFSSGGSLCQDEDELQDWISWAIEQDKIINPGKADENRVTQFAYIQYNSTFITDDKLLEVRLNLDKILHENLWIPTHVRKLSSNSDLLLAKVLEELIETKKLKTKVQRTLSSFVFGTKNSSKPCNYLPDCDDLSSIESSSSEEEFTGFKAGSEDEYEY